MSHRIRRILSAALVVVAASVTTACVIPVPSQTTPATDPVQTTQPATEPDETAQPAASGPTEADEAGLAAYVEGEQSATAEVFEANPGVYVDVVIDGTFETVTGDAVRPDGVYAVVTFLYVYAEPADWDAASAHLDGQRDRIDDMCESTLFPTIRSRGVTTPISIVYAYGDVTTGGPEWSHTCSTW